METLIRYRTADGRNFKTVEAAERHEVWLAKEVERQRRAPLRRRILHASSRAARRNRQYHAGWRLNLNPPYRLQMFPPQPNVKVEYFEKGSSFRLGITASRPRIIAFTDL